MDFTPYDILSCSHMPDPRPGDMLMPQRVGALLNISTRQAMELMNELVKLGYLTYDEGGDKKFAGWHYTPAGIALLG